MREVKTQKKFEELSKLGDWFYVTSGSWVARGNSYVVARGNSYVVARDYSHVEARGYSHVEARDYSYVVARGNSYVVARDTSHVVAWGNSYVVARGNSHVVAWGNSHVVAWDTSHVEARGNSHVEATSPYVSVLARSAAALLSGGYILGNKTLSPTEWLNACGVKIERGSVILYKSLTKKWVSQNGVIYKKGRRTIAPDWNEAFTGECGCGLHFSPTVTQARSFRDEGVYVACKVKIKDMASLPAFAQYPDKIRARACVPLYQVNEKGERIE